MGWLVLLYFFIGFICASLYLYYREGGDVDSDVLVFTFVFWPIALFIYLLVWWAEVLDKLREKRRR